MGATCALSAGNHQFDATVKVRQNVRMLVSTNFDRYITLPSGSHPTHRQVSGPRQSFACVASDEARAARDQNCVHDSYRSYGG